MPTTLKELEQARKKALVYLQRTDIKTICAIGAFCDKDCLNKVSTTYSVLPLAICSSCVGGLSRDVLGESGVRWRQGLLEELESLGDEYSYNYVIDKYHKGEKGLPDDLDDTAFAIQALIKNGKDVDEELILKIIGLESDEGGPYRTWYVPDEQKYKKWHDIDPVVNANLLYALSLLDISLDNTRSYLIEKLRTGDYNSQYYSSPLVFLLYLSRYSLRSADKKIQKQLGQELKKYNYVDLSNIEKLFFVLIAQNLGQEPESSQLEEILGLQQKEGSLPAMPFCLDFSVEGENTYAGSKILSTSLLVELLTSRIDRLKKDQDGGQKSKPSMNDKLARSALDRINKIIRSDFQEVDSEKLSPGEGMKSLVLPIGLGLELSNVKESQEILINLSVALYFGWMSFTLLDDLIDGQSSNDNAPISTKLLLKHLELMRGVLKSKERIRDYEEAINNCVVNYIFEAQHLRFTPADLKNGLDLNEGYKYIERRMSPFAKALSFIPVLLETDNAEAIAKEIYEVTISAMIIDQLNDDAHDWKEDLELGIMTFPLMELLKDGVDTKDHEFLFWENVMPTVISVCQEEYKEANLLLSQSEVNLSFMRKYLDKAIGPINIAQEERRKMMKLIKYYEAK